MSARARARAHPPPPRASDAHHARARVRACRRCRLKTMIRTFVLDYLAAYYPTDAALREDDDVRSFVAEYLTLINDGLGADASVVQGYLSTPDPAKWRAVSEPAARRSVGRSASQPASQPASALAWRARRCRAVPRRAAPRCAAPSAARSPAHHPSASVRPSRADARRWSPTCSRRSSLA